MASREKSGTTPGGRKYWSHKTSSGQVTEVSPPGSDKGHVKRTVKGKPEFSYKAKITSRDPKTDEPNERIVNKGPTKKFNPRRKK